MYFSTGSCWFTENVYFYSFCISDNCEVKILNGVGTFCCLFEFYMFVYVIHVIQNGVFCYVFGVKNNENIFYISGIVLDSVTLNQTFYEKFLVVLKKISTIILDNGEPIDTPLLLV
jgi:hypothetical protein